MMAWLRCVWVVCRRELASMVATPIAAVFLVIFLLLQGLLTFELGDFLGRDQADLAPFFGFLPWVLLLLVPALSMRLWAEERRAGTIEMLLTLPITIAQAVLGKFLAGLLSCAVAILLTTPFVAAVNALGRPDNAVIASGYLGTLCLSAALVSVGCAMSAATRAQIVAFVATLAVCFAFAASGSPVLVGTLRDWSPGLADIGRALSVATRFEPFARGVIALNDLLYFAAFTAFWLFVCGLLLQHRRAA